MPQRHHQFSHHTLAPPVPRSNFAIAPREYRGPRAEEVLAQRKKHLSAGQYHFYSAPLMLVEASMQYCFDDKGKQYVDCYSNVCHVGHCHPHVTAACSAALHSIVTNTRYLHPNIVQYAEKLKAKLPNSLSVCYFVNSGSEANDLAMRLARIHTEKKGVVCLAGAYHGTTCSCTGVSPSLSTGTKEGSKDYQYCSRDVKVAPVADTYYGPFKADDPRAADKYAAQLGEVIDSFNGNCAAFIHESVQGVGGQVVWPQGYLQKAYEAAHRAGAVTIADEVQTGFGRTGTHFWAFEAQDVVPDILVMGKPIGNGFPLGAVVTTAAIARSFDDVQYFNTNGGNPVACAAGLAVLEVIERDHLQENALVVSRHLMKNLHKLKAKHPLVGDVRGVGLFIGVELVRDHRTLEPAVAETKQIMERAKDFGLLLGKGGLRGNVIRIKPPLCFNEQDADFLVNTLSVMLGELETHPLTAEQVQMMTTVTQEKVNSYVCGGSSGKLFDQPDDASPKPYSRQSGPRSLATATRNLQYESDTASASSTDGISRYVSAKKDTNNYSLNGKRSGGKRPRRAPSAETSKTLSGVPSQLRRAVERSLEKSP